MAPVVEVSGRYSNLADVRVRVGSLTQEPEALLRYDAFTSCSLIASAGMCRRHSYSNFPELRERPGALNAGIRQRVVKRG